MSYRDWQPKGKYRKFSKKDYAESDAIAKDHAIRFFKERGWELISNEEMFGIGDILVLNPRNGDVYSIEIERKFGWSSIEFPFDDIHIPFRKSTCKADLFLMFNADFTTLFITSMANIKHSPIVRKFNINSPDRGEPFFSLDKSKVRFIVLEKPIKKQENKDLKIEKSELKLGDFL